MTIWKLLNKKIFKSGYSQGFREGGFVARREIGDALERAIEQKYDAMDEYYDNLAKEEEEKESEYGKAMMPRKGG